jgi:hypothetical protein
MEAFDLSVEQYEEELKIWKKTPEDERGKRPSKPPKPVLTRITVNDTTAEALVPILKDNSHGIVLVRDELIGWVQGMNQYREGGKGADQQFWLSAWSGATETVDRKKTRDQGPLRVRHPFIGVVGGLTPDKLPTLRGDRPRRRAEQDGFIDRVLLCYPKELLVEEENWKLISEEAQGRLAKVYDRLRSLQMVPLEEGGVIKSYRPFVVKLNASGRRPWQDFTREHAHERNDADFPRHLVGPWSELRGYCVRLALFVHYLRWATDEIEGDDDGTEPVDGEDVRRAVRLVNYFKSHAKKVYATMDADHQAADARHVVKWLERHPELTVFSRHDLHQGLRRHFRFAKPERLDGPLNLIEDMGYIRPLPPEPCRGRPPLPKYERNPLWTHPRNPKNPQKDGSGAGDDSTDGAFKDFEDIEDVFRGEKTHFRAGEQGENGQKPGDDGDGDLSSKSPESEEHGDAWKGDD